MKRTIELTGLDEELVLSKPVLIIIHLKNLSI